MLDDGHHLPWTEEQWASMQAVVQEAARKARVASSFLPLVGPLPPGQASVPRLSMDVQPVGSVLGPPPHKGSHVLSGEASARLKVDDGKTLKLTTISCNVYLTTQQAEDSDLASARQMLGRAAAIIGRLEDAIVFNGQPSQRPPAGAPQLSIWEVEGGGRKNPGLLTYPDPDDKASWPKNLTEINLDAAYKGPASRGGYTESLVSGIVAAIEALEELGQYGPFACVLGDVLYQAANTPSQGSLVLPGDRILPFLGGPLLRSSAVPKDQGVVVALAGSPIDLVVASDVHVSYLQRSVEPRYILRVSERFVLRMKQAEAVRRLQASP
jgi:uncharacterized linocin/CFP29 family protein